MCATTGLLFVTDKISKWQFLVDTGSDLCVYPHRLTLRHKGWVNYDLCAANGTKIHIHGWVPINLNLELCRDFMWRFLVADVTYLIGVDFLSFRHSGGLPKKESTGRVHFIFCTGPSRQLADPQPQHHHRGTSVDSLLAEFSVLTRRPKSSAKCVTTLSIISRLYRAHRSLVGHRN